MKMPNFHQQKNKYFHFVSFFLKMSSIMRYQNISCFSFSHSHKKLLGIKKKSSVSLPLTGMISYRWSDFQPVVQNQNWLLPIVLTVENALKLFFVISIPSGLHINTLKEHWSKNQVVSCFSGMISYRWLEFQPMVQNYKLAFTDSFKS